MALPSDQENVNVDQATDDPKLARVDIKENVDKFNSLKSVLGDGVELDVGDALKDDGAGNIAVDLAADSGIEIVGAKLRSKTPAANGLKRLAADAGIGIDLEQLVETTDVEEFLDFLLLFDNSVGALRKLLPTNLTGSPPGAITLYAAATAPPGWVMMEGGSIGNTTSGASVRANQDTQTLFELLWNNSTDTELPVSTGRGASANADWIANKNIELPDGRSRVFIGTGTGSGLSARTNFSPGGVENQSISGSQMASQQHIQRGSTSTGGILNTLLRTLTGVVDVNASNTALAGSDAPHNNVQPFLPAHSIIKL